MHTMIVDTRTQSTAGGSSDGAEMRAIYAAFGAYFLILFMSVMPPFFGFVNRAEPIVLGLPFLLFWIFFVGVAMSLGLVALFLIEVRRGEVV